MTEARQGLAAGTGEVAGEAHQWIFTVSRVACEAHPSKSPAGKIEIREQLQR
jgi:hypothetical protein